MRTPPSGPFGTVQIFSIQGTVAVNFAVQDDWHNIQVAGGPTWLQEITNPDAPFSINTLTGDITYLGGIAVRVRFDYAFSIFSQAANDVLIEGTLDINNALTGTQNDDTFSQRTSALGLTANGFPFVMAGYKVVTELPVGAIIRPIFANTVNSDNVTIEKAQITAQIVQV